MLLAACGQAEQKQETKKVEETVNEVKETIGVTVIQKNIKRKSCRNQKRS
ncbi:ribosomal protein L5 domain protein [Bacillus thuringiensis]|nr:ribosomal protein L5 domain protein [Bacillus thuringiensis]MBG9675417.1 ribosomal protein L5 domain protein [Bacillus thuringiensis]